MFFVSTDEFYLQLIYNVWRAEKYAHWDSQ